MKIPSQYSKFQMIALIILWIISTLIVGFIINVNYKESPSHATSPQYFQSGDYYYNVLSLQSSKLDKTDIIVDSSEDLFFLKSVIDDIFPFGYENLSDEKKVIEIGKYIAVILRYKKNSGSATKILKDGYSICGGRSTVFQNLLKIIGIPSRWVGIFVPYAGSHAIAEAYYDGQWHLFDPTFGTFFYSEPEYNLKGYIPSLSQLISNHDYHLLYTTEHIRVGNYNSSIRNEPITPVQNNSLENFVNNFSNRYQNWFKTAEPVAYKNNQICSFPFNANFIENANISLGIINSDIIDHSPNATQDTANLNMHYIGLSSPVSVHTWFIMSPSEGYFNLSYYSTTNINSKLSIFPLQSINIVDQTQENNVTDFIFHTNSNQSSFMILCESGRYDVDAVRANWLGVHL